MKKKKVGDKLHMTVDAQNLFKSIGNDPHMPPDVGIGLTIIHGCMFRIAKRAVETQDKEILNALQTMKYVEPNGLDSGNGS